LKEYLQNKHKTEWNITADNIEKEKERTSREINFYFLFRWFFVEKEKKKDKRSKEGLLHHYDYGDKSNGLVTNFKSIDELLATAYI